jgi:selenocysteine lyase/cysteine desulfurase
MVHGERFDVSTGYLNTASIGVPPAFAGEIMAEEVRRWRGGLNLPPDYDVSVAAARRAWASLVGVPVERVAIGASVSQLIGTVAASLPTSTRVLTVANEFTSVTFPFAAQGMRVTEVAPGELLSHVEDHDLVAVSVVQSSDGTVLDLDALRAATSAASSEVAVLLDVTQAAGWLPLELDWVDWAIGGGYKWLMAPRGAAWMSTSPSALERTVAQAANWFAARDPWDGIYGLPLRLADDARRLDHSPVWFAQLGAAATVPWVAGLDMTAVRDHCVGLADSVLKAKGLTPRGSAIIAIDLTPDQAERLRDAGVVCSIRAGRTRLSFHMYNTEADVDLVLDSTA